MKKHGNLIAYITIALGFAAIFASSCRSPVQTAVTAISLGFILLSIANMIRGYNMREAELAAREQAHRTAFQKETEKLYENIYELDISHNCAANEDTQQYFQSLGVPAHTPYDQALRYIAQHQIKKEYRQGYITTFGPPHVLKSYASGVDTLRYDFLGTEDGQTYHWIRITSRIFRWEGDHSIHMFAYRQNIDAEKQRELQMLDKIHRDSFSGLYNKAATHEQIDGLLQETPDRFFGFFILDIDDFKTINDRYGHQIGDLAIAEFASVLKEQFREEDIVGRIGGDEFVVFVPISSPQQAETKAKELLRVIHYKNFELTHVYRLSASIGVAVAPRDGTDFKTLYRHADRALYQTKEHGKNGYTIYDDSLKVRRF